MSDDFIPLNQSTPVQSQKRWPGQHFQQSTQRNSWKQNQKRYNNYNKNKGNSDTNDNNMSYEKNKHWSDPHFQGSGQHGSGKSQEQCNYNKNNSSVKNDNNTNYGTNKGIDAYLHPAMLKNPWSQLQKQL